MCDDINYQKIYKIKIYGFKIKNFTYITINLKHNLIPKILN